MQEATEAGIFAAEVDGSSTVDHRGTPVVDVALGVDVFNQSTTGDKARTILAGHQDAAGLPCVLVFHLMQDPISAEELSPCLSSGNPKQGQASIGVCIALDYAAFNQGKNARFNFGIGEKGTAFTITANGPGAVCYCIATQQGGAEILKNLAPTVTASASMSGNNQPWICFIGINGEKAGTLDANYFKGCGEREGKEREIICMAKCSDKMKRVICIVRRLTPTECARLQGMPDWWCSDVPHADAPEYKMWGNGMALPCVLYIFEGLKKYDKERRITS